jgi:hypothetical protein
MPLTFDPEIAAALAPMAESGFARARLCAQTPVGVLPADPGGLSGRASAGQGTGCEVEGRRPGGARVVAPLAAANGSARALRGLALIQASMTDRFGIAFRRGRLVE